METARGKGHMLPPYNSRSGRASTARRLHHANRDSYKLFTLGPHCGHFPCGASLHGTPGSWRARVGCQKEDWRLEVALFSKHTGWSTLSLCRPLRGKEVGLKKRKLNQTRFTLETTGEDKKGHHVKVFLMVWIWGWGLGLSSWLGALIIVTLLWKVFYFVLLIAGNTIHRCSNVCNSKSPSYTSGILSKVYLSIFCMC